MWVCVWVNARGGSRGIYVGEEEMGFPSRINKDKNGFDWFQV